MSKCVACLRTCAKNRKLKSWKINCSIDVTIASKLFEKRVVSGDIFCAKCRLKISREKIAKKNEYSPSTSHSSSSPNSEILDTCTTIREDALEVIEVDVPCSAYTESRCVVCHSYSNRNRVPNILRLNTYIQNKLYLPRCVRSCKDHYVNNIFYAESVQRISKVSSSSLIPVDDFLWFFNETTKRAQTKSTLLDSFDNLTISENDCHSITGLSKENFYMLRSNLHSMRESKNRTIIEALVVFLAKLKTGISNQPLASLLGLRNYQLVGNYCQEIETAFEKDILPYWIGASSQKREFLIERQSPIAKTIVSNSELLLIADGTYAYHQKSANNTYQRKSFSVQKGTHLCKPFTVCTTDGFIIDFFGPYVAINNDATILESILKNETSFTQLLKKNDCFILDRGFRDVIPKIKQMGFDARMPSISSSKTLQLSVEEANSSRSVTKIRWVVELIHGLIKQKWKLLSHEFKNQSLVKLRTYFRIAGALHNMFAPKLLSDKEDMQYMIEKFSERHQTENSLHTFITEKNLLKKRSLFVKLDANEIDDFPCLDDQSLKQITLGNYQLSKSVAYIAEHMRLQNTFYICKLHENIICCKIQSRHKSRTEYKCCVKYLPFGTTIEAIKGWCCTCKSGLRTLGCCVHVASTILYLSNLRYASKIPNPANKLVNLFTDVKVTLNESSDDE